ncbi:MAG: hypothetical protein KDJ52_20235 [Anaerolineae bacterium]|nr:hypothetical protein [Anaerolineae bacterium]
MNKPIVDGLESDLSGQAEVVRLDIMTAVGRQAASMYGVRGIPTLMVVDGQGEPILIQMSLVRPGPIKKQIEQLLAQTQ